MPKKGINEMTCTCSPHMQPPDPRGCPVFPLSLSLDAQLCCMDLSYTTTSLSHLLQARDSWRQGLSNPGSCILHAACHANPLSLLHALSSLPDLSSGLSAVPS